MGDGDSVDETAEVTAILDAMEKSLSEIESHLAPLVGPDGTPATAAAAQRAPAMKDITAQISHLENAKLQAGIAYSLNTLFWSMHMGAAGCTS